MERCHVLLQASLTAADGDGEGGAPVVLLDAQASGLPVVATRHADIPEYVLDGRSGLLAPEGDVEALAGCIGAMVEDPARWPEMGREGRRHVEEQVQRSGAVRGAGRAVRRVRLTRDPRPARASPTRCCSYGGKSAAAEAAGATRPSCSRAGE